MIISLKLITPIITSEFKKPINQPTTPKVRQWKDQKGIWNGGGEEHFEDELYSANNQQIILQ